MGPYRNAANRTELDARETITRVLWKENSELRRDNSRMAIGWLVTILIFMVIAFACATDHTRSHAVLCLREGDAMKVIFLDFAWLQAVLDADGFEGRVVGKTQRVETEFDRGER